MTETGSIMGTAQYLSPEQAQGHAVSARSDLYSIGIVLYELLTGHVPFEGDSAVSIALKQVGESPTPPSVLNPAIPPALEAVVLHALNKDPAQRFADAEEFIAALEGAREGVPAVPVGQSTAAFAAAAPPTDPTRLAPAPVAAEPAAAFVYPGEPLPPPVRREWGRWPWVLLALLLVAALGFGAYQLTRVEQVVVPNVVGKDSSTAATMLQNKGFDVSTLNVTSDAPKGQVLRSNPQPGSKVDKASTVTLNVSQGPGTANVPGVTGKGRRTAHKALVAAGFAVREIEQPSDTVAKDHVIGTEPIEGTPVDKGAPVTLLVSSGPEQVKVPDVTGTARTDAEPQLTAAGFKVKIVKQESKDKDPGTVLAQNPAGNADAPKGSVVTLTVAKAPAEATVPDVTGSTQDEAANLLTGAGFKVKFSRQDVPTPDDDGVVLAQNPPGDAKAKTGATVTVTIGHFVETTTAPPPTTTP
jgi:serine/threonine-protein kinase